MNPIELKVKRSYYTRVIILGILSLGIGAVLMWLEYRRWAHTMDSVGVTRRDGEKFLWQDLQEKKRINMRNLPHAPLNHIELIFKDGKALIFPLMLENSNAVMAYIEKIPARN